MNDEFSSNLCKGGYSNLILSSLFWFFVEHLGSSIPVYKQGSEMLSIILNAPSTMLLSPQSFKVRSD